ncbi:MAG: carboxylating nicotinate-nucleotide diphosphorylase [Bacteroidales bacterium]
MNPNFEELLQQSMEIWLAEDIGDGDHTTLSTIPENAKGKANLIAKDQGIIAGIFAILKLIEKFDPELETKVYISDGSPIKYGDTILSLHGKVHSILQIERLMLNLLQRLSGIATQTHLYAKELEGFKTKILDTRKTTPGLRFLEKEAVRLGGGVNHRVGLFDMILIKDNHIDFAGGVKKAIEASKKYLSANNLKMKIEVEARNLNDIEEILDAGGVDRILLDNFSTELTKKAVALINGRVETESSGGISFKTLKDYAVCGVDYISVGALTHQIKSLDLSLKAVF